MEQKEHKIGERFKDGNTLLETIKSIHCSECFYRAENGSAEPCGRKSKQGPCCPSDRIDKTDVIFKEIKDMKEENLNKEEHFYIWGVPNRGEEVAKLLESKGLEISNTKDKGFSDSRIIIYEEDGVGRFIQEEYNRSIVDLITSNWTELKLPYQPKDKELVWAWDDNDDCLRVLAFYDIKNNCCFCLDGMRDGANYEHYESFEGEYPQWAKESLSKLED